MSRFEKEKGKAGMDKPAMRKAYKEARRPMGVFRIKSTLGGIVYLGSGADLPARINRHRAELRFGNHRNRELQETWNSLGESAFDFEVLDVLDHEELLQTEAARELRVLMEMWIRRLEEEGHVVVTL